LKCPKCQFDNPETSRFCGDCGTRLGAPEDKPPLFTKTLQAPIFRLPKGSIIAKKYEILDELGRGGMGVVYKAQDMKLKRIVALKFLPPELTQDAEARERFIHEAQAASGLDHQNICTIHEIGETEDGQIYIAMAFYKGESLREKLKQGALEAEEALRIILQVVDGLSRAHKEGIIHRDIKPANLMITTDGQVKIVDFGLAKLAGTTRITRDGTTMGTAAYMSPEQVRGEDTDQRTDVWSLGIVLYETITGQLPFKGDGEQAVIYSILNNEPEPAKDLSPDLEKIILKMLAKDRHSRYSSIDEVRTNLLEFLGERPISMPKISLARMPRTVRLMFIILLGAIGFLGLFWLAYENFFHGPKPALAFQKRDWILISDFENQTGDQIFDRSLKTALTIGIQQSQYINVFPESRMQETLRRMRKEKVGKLDEGLACEIALREGIKAVLACGINQVGNVYLLSGRLIDPDTRLVALTEGVQAAGKDQVLTSLNGLATRIRKKLGESMASISRQNTPLLRATTASLEALKTYVEGKQLTGSNDKAGYDLIRQAVAMDPDFALAHADLGVHYYISGEREKGEEHFKKALSLLDRLTLREQLWIRALVEDWRGNREEAVDQYKTYLAKYPGDLGAWYRLGWTYMAPLQQPDPAIEAFKKVLELDPSNLGAYINIATCYNIKKQYSEALKNYQKAFDLSPEQITGMYVNHEYGFMLVEMGEIEKARETFEKMFSKEDWLKARGHRSLALLDMYQGKYSAATNHLQESILINKVAGSKVSLFRDRMFLANVYRVKGMTDEFESELAEAGRLLSTEHFSPEWMIITGKLYPRMGKIDEANKLLNEMSLRMKDTVALSGVARSTISDEVSFNILKGEIALANQRAQEAVDILELTYRLKQDSNILESLAKAYLVLSKPEEAIKRYQQIISLKELGEENQECWILAHYELGKIYEQLNDLPKAQKYYEHFLNIWKEADPDIPMVVEARQRLAAIKNR